MIITSEVLETFNACHEGVQQFQAEYPDGLDISTLWGTDDQANELWLAILSGWMKKHVGWAITVGLLPARIRANLRGADLNGANLRGANLSEANLEGANLYGANLYRANLYRASLEGADLRGASLEGADLRGVSLEGASLEGANLEGARANQYTIWPAKFTVPGSVLLEEDLTLMGVSDKREPAGPG